MWTQIFKVKHKLYLFSHVIVELNFVDLDKERACPYLISKQRKTSIGIKL
jgi:hypothetical protein